MRALEWTNRTCSVADGDVDLRSAADTAWWCWTATDVAAVGVVVGGAPCSVTRDGDGGRGDGGGRERARDHRGAWRGCGRCNYCCPVPVVGRTCRKCPNTVYHLLPTRAQPPV